MTYASIMAVRALVDWVEGAGVPRARFLAEAGLHATQLDDGCARISLSDYRRVVRAALASSGDPALGLHMGEDAHTGWFDVLGHLAQHSANLREALNVCQRYSRIAKDDVSLELSEQHDVATIQFVPLCGDSPEIRFVAEFASSAMLWQLIRRFIGDAAPRRVLFAYPAPAHHGEYTRIFAGREQFSQAFTGIEIERGWLDRKHLNHSPELCVLLQSRADMLIARLDRDATAAARVQHWLASQSFRTKPTMDAVARDLGMSARSLRRRLSAEGADFSVLLEDARAACAKRTLAAPHRTIQEAAYELGFANPAAFTRAFKRWTGLSPSEFRAAR